MPAGDSKYNGFNQFYRRVLAAFGGGALTIMFTYPWELFNTRMTADMNGYKSHRLYNNTYDCFNLTQLEGGAKGMYKGCTVAAFSILPSTIIMLPMYDFFTSAGSKMKSDSDNSLDNYVNQYVNPKFMAGFTTMLIWYPLDTVKRCLQVSESRGYSTLDKGYLGTLKAIWKANGRVWGLYRGVHLAAIKAFPSIYIQFLLYDYFKSFSALNEREPSLRLIQTPTVVLKPETME
jgi:hypothetical protein